MKRALLKQIGNEWRDNIWLIIELTIVTIVIWFLIGTISPKLHALFQPMGIANDYENVYIASIKWIPEESPEFTDFGEDDNHNNLQDLRYILSQLRGKPYVEAVGVHKNGLPFFFSAFNTAYRAAGSEDSIGYSTNQRLMSTGMVKVLGLQSLEGLSTEQLTEILEKGEVLISNHLIYEYTGRNPAELVGKQLESLYNRENEEPKLTPRVGALIRAIPRSEFESMNVGTTILPLDENNDEALQGAWDVAIRVKSGMGRMLEEDFRNDISLSRLRNARLTELHTLAQQRYITQYIPTVELRLYISGICFMIFIIFLGLLGTFWFRVQQRTGEIALRKVTGATSGDIVRRLIGEVFVLFAIAVIIATVITVILVRSSVIPVYMEYGYWKQSVLTPTIGTLLIMSIAVMLGVWFPAYRAMRVQPAIALKEE
ncbi:MAG: FtsX-like permease family protein [Muribaculaceae bacterium]|nr:FtsX-like permease family protein [Muribaculaceae bacterium]